MKIKYTASIVQLTNRYDFYFSPVVLVEGEVSQVCMEPCFIYSKVAV